MDEVMVDATADWKAMEKPPDIKDEEGTVHLCALEVCRRCSNRCRLGFFLQLNSFASVPYDTNPLPHIRMHTCTHLLPLSPFPPLPPFPPFPPSPCLPSVDTPPPKKPKVESMTSPANSASDSHPATATASCYNSNGISNPHKDLNTTPSAALSTPSASSSTSSLAPNSQVPSRIQNSNHIAPQVSNSSANIGSGSRSSSSSVVNQHASHFNVGGHLAAAVTNSTGQQPPTHGQQHTNDVSVGAQISHE